MKRVMVFLVLLLAVSVALPGTAYYAAVGGSGNGTKGSPWKLEGAFTNPSVKPGDTVYIRGGRFMNPTSGQDNGDPRTGFKAWVPTISGTPSAPIVVRSYPGELAILDGGDTKTENILHIGVHDVWFWGIEVMSSDTRRLATTPVNDTSFPDPGDIKRGTCVNFDGATTTRGIKFIHCIIDNGFVGIGDTWASSVDAEFYGCIVYNNGWDTPGDRPHGHGFYVQNYGTGNIRLMEDNLVWGNYENNFQAYGSADQGVERCNDFRLIGNASTKNGGSGHVMLIGGGSRVNRLTYMDNMTYTVNSSVNFGWVPYGAGLDASNITNNWMVGGAGKFQAPLGMIFGGNYCYWPSGTEGAFSQSNFPSNTYAGSIPNKTFVRRSKYEAGRANIIIYNGNGLSNVVVSVGSLLPAGANYTVRDAMNWHGAPVVSGKYNGSDVTIPVGSLSTVEQPYGSVGTTGVRTHTAPYFFMGVITGDAPDPVTPPPPVAIKYRQAIFHDHSVGGVYFDRSRSSNLTPPTTIPKEIAAYNSSKGYTGTNAVSMSDGYSPPPASANNNNWSRWANIFENKDSFMGYADVAKAPVVVIKTCYIQQQIMETDPGNTVTDLQGYMRRIVAVMKAHPETFFVVWNNHPAPTDGASSRAVKSAQFSVWMKDVLAKEATFPKNVYVFDIFRTLADGTTGVCPANYGSGGEGPGGDHPSNEAVAIVDPKFIRETFDAAIAYETGAPPPVVTIPVVTLSANPPSIVGPGSSTLSYSVSSDATSASIDNGVGTVFGSGTKVVQVSATTTYRITASNTAGSASKTATVTVTATPPPPPIDTTGVFKAGDKVKVAPGDVNCRNQPTLFSTVIKLMVAGTKGTIISGPTVADGYHFYRVQYSDAQATLGYSAGELLLKDSTVTPPPPPPADTCATARAQGIAQGFAQAVAKFDSVRQVGFNAGKASVICPPVNTKADSLYKLIEPFFVKP